MRAQLFFAGLVCQTASYPFEGGAVLLFSKNGSNEQWHHDKIKELNSTSLQQPRKGNMNDSMSTPTQTCDPHSHPVQILSLAAFIALGWILSAVQFWRKIVADRRAAAAAAILPVAHPLPSGPPLKGVAIAIPATIEAAKTLLSAAAGNAAAAAENLSANPAAAADKLSSAADNAATATAMLSAAAAAMRPASTDSPIAATRPFATTAAFSTAASMFSAGGPSTTTTTPPATTPPATNVLALSELAFPTETTSSRSPHEEAAALRRRVPS